MNLVPHLCRALRNVSVRLSRMLLRRSLALLIALAWLIAAPALAATYTVNADGTVTDAATGLTWMRCAMGQTLAGSTCSESASLYTWIEANALTGTVTFAGSSDWRLPNVRELQTIVALSAYNPAIDNAAFPNTSATGFWTASVHADYSANNAWNVSFSDGHTDYDNQVLPFQVRLVRAGQSSGSLLNPVRPTTDYTDNGNGTVTHTPTGLMWKRCTEGQTWDGTASTCTGTATSMAWDIAKLTTSTFAGNSDWRMPTEEELLSLVDYTVFFPAINTSAFPNTPNQWFWSASVSASNSSNAWITSDGSTFPHNVSAPALLRLVRGGSSFGTSSPTLNFVAGWNLVGNGFSGVLDVATAFGDANRVSTVWKWIASSGTWAFYAPSLAGQALIDYAASKGYVVLTTIEGGEGFWVNAKTTFVTPLPSGTAIDSASFRNMNLGWSLISIGDNKTPRAFNDALNPSSDPVAVVVPYITSLWAWEAVQTKWYFYAPALEAQGGTVLTDYIASKGYLDFTANGKTLGPSTGFWVNKP